MQIRPDFSLQEFVPPSVWNQFGSASRWFLDPRLLDLAQFYRDYFDAPVWVNTWAWDGRFKERGFRLPTTNVGARLSQHKFGRAFDCNVEGMTPEEVRERIMDNEALFMEKGLTTLESGEIAKTWVHSDIRTTTQDSILIVTP
jgi:hypothetical protein